MAMAAASVGLMAGPASAVTCDPIVPCTDTSGTEANVEVLSGITLTGITDNFTLTGAPGEEPYSTMPEVEFKVWTNNFNGYTVTVESRTATMLPSIVGNTDEIQIDVLKVANSDDDYVGMSEDPTTVHIEAGPSLDAGDDVVSDFSIQIPAVTADTYTATLDYIASTQ